MQMKLNVLVIGNILAVDTADLDVGDIVRHKGVDLLGEGGACLVCECGKDDLFHYHFTDQRERASPFA